MFTLPKHLIFSKPYLVQCLLGTELILTAYLRVHQHTEQNKKQKRASMRSAIITWSICTKHKKQVKGGYFLYRALKKVLLKVLTSEKF